MQWVRGLSVMLMLFVVTLLTLTLVPFASAQTPGGPAPAPSPPAATPTPAADGGGEGWLTAIIILIWLLVIIGLAAKLVDLKGKRDAEAIQVQAGISNALLRDQRLGTLPIVPTARASLWKRSPITLEVCGVVPTPELREAALRMVRDEASRMRPDIHVVDGLAVSPCVMSRAA